MFVIFTLALALESFCISCHNFVTQSNIFGFSTAFQQNFVALCLTIYSGSLGIALLLLLLIQIILISRGLTTVEFLKNYWHGLINPYNEGPFTNCLDLFKSDCYRQNFTTDYLDTLKVESRKSLNGSIEINMFSNSTSEESASSSDFYALKTGRSFNNVKL